MDVVTLANLLGSIMAFLDVLPLGLYTSVDFYPLAAHWQLVICIAII